MSSIPNLNNLASIARLWRGKATGKKSFKFNGSNGYIQQVGYSWGVVRKQNDWSRDYWQCYWGYFNIWDSSVHGLDNRSVQTQKHVFYMDDLINWVNLSWYAWWLSVKVNTVWQIEVEAQWTWSIRVTTVWTFTAWSVVNVVVRINNTLPSWTARVVWDLDIFIGWVKDSKTSAVLWNSTWTTNFLTRWAYNTTTNLFRWRLYNFSLWNRALSDAECQAEWLSNRSVVTPSWLVNTWDTTDTSQAISRTWYNLNVQGNVSVWTDADGKYINFNGNRDWTASTWTEASIFNTSSAVFNQNTSFTIKTKIKVNTLPANNITWIFASYNDFWIYFWSAWQLIFRTNGTWGWTYTHGTAMTLWQVMDLHMVFDAPSNKFYAYINWTLVNTWWTIAWTFATLDRYLWDWWRVSTWVWTSCNKYIYHARTRARALTQSDINADIALGNNTNNDPTIVASYRPDNLINQQFLTFNSDYTNAVWSKNWTTVTADFSTAPDWTNTADRLTISWALHNWIFQTSTTLTGSSLASKTFIVKCFAKVASWTWTFRLRMDHAWVDTNQYSTDQTATTTWQEFTFTRTFTSSTAWTWITTAVTTWSAWAAVTLEVRNVRVFLVNEILYDNSPNIGWYVWPLVNRYYSSWVRLGADWTNVSLSQPVLYWCYWYNHIRNTVNTIITRYDDRIGARQSTYDIWTWFRGWVHIISWIERDWTAFKTALWVNWVKVDNDSRFLDASHVINQVLIFAWRWWSWYLNGNLRDSRFFTSPTDLTDAQALMITNWGDPAGVTKVLHRDAIPSDTTNYVTDKSGNGRVGYITGWVTKTF